MFSIIEYFFSWGIKKSLVSNKLIKCLTNDEIFDFESSSENPKNNDLYEIGIHIADVSHFFNTKGLINKEAEKRATSVYLVDRTIPMLPEKLSNDLLLIHTLSASI